MIELRARRAIAAALLIPAYAGLGAALLYIVFLVIQGAVGVLASMPIGLLVVLGVMDWSTIEHSLSWCLRTDLEMGALALLATLVHYSLGWVAGKVYPPWQPPFMSKS
jgi:hypothetical protein